LKLVNVALVSASENLNSMADEKSQVFTMGIMGVMAHYFSIELSEKVTRGMKVSASHCRFNGGVIPLGYKIVEKNYEIDVNNLPIVQEAFRRVGDGEDMISVINDFNKRGFKTARGNQFTKGSLQNLLRNPKYIGVYKYADITKEGGIPAIVSETDFYKVQARLKTKEHKAKKGGKAMVDYLLTGKLYCGECGSPMVGYSSTGRHSKTYRYYICSAKHRHVGKCVKSPVPKDAIEGAVIEESRKLFDDPKLMDELYTNVEAELKRMFSNQLETKKNYEAELKSLMKRKDNVISGLEINPSIAKDIEPKLKELNSQIESVKERIAVISAEVKPADIDKDSVRYMIDTIVLGKGKQWKKEEVDRNIVSILVQKAVIYEDNRIVIYFNLDNENAPSTLEGAYKQLVVNRSSEHTKRIYSVKGSLLRMEIVGSGEYRAVYKGRVTYPRIR